MSSDVRTVLRPGLGPRGSAGERETPGSRHLGIAEAKRMLTMMSHAAPPLLSKVAGGERLQHFPESAKTLRRIQARTGDRPPHSDPSCASPHRRCTCSDLRLAQRPTDNAQRLSRASDRKRKTRRKPRTLPAPCRTRRTRRRQQPDVKPSHVFGSGNPGGDAREAPRGQSNSGASSPSP
jgi:hypothetical protein